MMTMMTVMIQFGLLFFVACSSPPGISYLDVIPKYPIYKLQEDITLICCNPNPVSHQKFEFYREGSNIYSTKQNKTCASYMFKIKTKEDIGPYHCVHWTHENGTERQSNMSDTITVQIAEIPLAPSISLKPEFPVYIRGEAITIICSPPDQGNKEIQYFKDEQKIATEGITTLYTIPKSTQEATGKYSCLYWSMHTGRKIESYRSLPVTVNVIEIPLAPSISLKPEFPVYIRGEAITIICSPPDQGNKEIQYFKDEQKIATEGITTLYTIPKSTQEATGKYSCLYWSMHTGRKIESYRSLPVTVNVIEIPLAPSISLNPEFPVYIRGEAITIICSPPDQGNKEIQYFKDEQKIATEGITTLYTIPKSTQEATGKYSCLYWSMHTGRKIESYRSLPVTVNVIEIPLAPSISLKPEFPVYISGEAINIICSPPDQGNKEIQYFKDEQKIATEGITTLYTIPKSTQEATGKYSCLYWSMHTGRKIESYRSLPVTVNVIEIPQAPSIILNPVLPVYISGEPINITCSPPHGTSVVSIQYFKDGQEIHKSKISKRMFTYLISSSSPETTGSYSCVYWFNHFERHIHSQRSFSVTINVADVPPAPVLEDKSGHSVFLMGDSLQMLCSLPSQYIVSQIHFYLGNKEVKSDRPGSRFNSTYAISNLGRTSFGVYSCQFKVSVSGRVMTSRRSNPLNITLTDPPLTPVLQLVPNHQVYVSGETINLRCFGSVGDTYNMYKDGQLLHSMSFCDPVTNLQRNYNGNYTCTYHMDIQGRRVESLTSQTVNIYVIDPLPGPNLTLVGPVEKIEDGFQVTLKCSAPDDDLLRTFYYFKATEENDVRNVTGVSASLVWELGPVNHAVFYCEYEEELRGRKIRSKRSQTLTIPLSETSMLTTPMIAGIIGVMSLVFCLTLVFWFYRRNKRQSTNERLHFSWYWKEDKTQHKVSCPSPLNPVRSNEETNEDLGMSRRVSRNPSHLSITTEKEDDALENTINFSTFQCEPGHSENLSVTDYAWSSSHL